MPGAATIGFQCAIEKPQRFADKTGRLMIGDGHRLAHGGVAVHAGMLAGRDGDMGDIFAGCAEVVHLTLGGKGMIGDGGEMAPGLFPMFVAVADRISRRRVRGAAFARVHAHDGVRHAGVLHHCDRRRTAEGSSCNAGVLDNGVLGTEKVRITAVLQHAIQPLFFDRGPNGSG